jgi:RNA polymerase sigma-70 factor (ECF subfamily)
MPRVGSLEPSDLILLQGIAAGNEDSFRCFFERWAPRLGRFLRRITGSREAGEDLLQEAFLRVLRGASDFEPRGTVAGWIYRICSNLAYSYWRRQRSSPVHLEAAEAPVACHPSALSDSPERIRWKRAFEHEARQALMRCPPNHRMVFILKVDQGLTYEQISEVLDCPTGTAKSRFHFAVRRLRQELKHWADEA